MEKMNENQPCSSKQVAIKSILRNGTNNRNKNTTYSMRTWEFQNSQKCLRDNVRQVLNGKSSFGISYPILQPRKSDLFIEDGYCSTDTQWTTTSNYPPNGKPAWVVKLEKTNPATLQEKFDATLRRKKKAEAMEKEKIAMKKYKENINREDKMMQIAYENMSLFERLQNVKAKYNRQEQLEWYQEQEQAMEQKATFPLFWKYDTLKPREAKVLTLAEKNPRPLAYVTVEIDDRHCDNLVFECYADTCPWTTAHFLSLCDKTKSFGGSRKRCMNSLMGTTEPKVVRDKDGSPLWFSLGGGSQGFYFDQKSKESSALLFDSEGVVAMSVHSQGEIMITFREIKALDDEPEIVSFATLAGGMDLLKTIAKHEENSVGSPRDQLVVTDCDVVESMKDVPPPKLIRDRLKKGRKKRELPQSPVVKMANFSK